MEDKIKAIEVLKTVLGTMVQEPIFESDQTIIGEKQFKMYLQKPIIEGEDRTKVRNKLMDLVQQL